MNRRIEKIKNNSKKFNISKSLLYHIENNKKEYIICTILFTIGIILSILFINNCNDKQLSEINSYIHEFLNNLKSINGLNYILLFFDSMRINIIILIITFILGLIVIGKPIIYLVIIGKGFIFGYTIGAFVSALGGSSGLLVAGSGMLLHNLILIPAFFELCIRSSKMCSGIIKDKKNIKIEFIRYMCFLLIILILFVISSLIEVFISYSLMIFIVQNLNI